MLIVIMIISKCRNCQSNLLKELFSLGKLSFTGKFPSKKKEIVPKAKINVIICNKCKLVQLDRNFNKKFLYGKDYGYRTGINKTMTNHVQDVVNYMQELTKLKEKEYVLDIASNDGTLLNFYSKKNITVGIDPIINKHKKYYKNINYKLSNFFSFYSINAKLPKVKFKIITALSMFYDLEDPNSFLKDASKLLDKDGVLLIEHADLFSIVKNNIFDTFCHEHLEYYSSKIIINMVKKHNLRVFDHKFNNINGGSSQYYICHNNAKYKKKETVKNILNIEKKFKIDKIITFKTFFEKIHKIKKKLINKLTTLLEKDKIIHGYGASTKGNVLLQYFGINAEQIKFIADRNPLKFNKYTPGTCIKIISENDSRKLKPDFFLVLPWHFREEILQREKIMIKKGTKFIFPLPDLRIE
jgi:2-polyprenyl-3-methyl-5-hydroxy-6-metoxy-1,4-benzoquinol methylase